MVKRFTRRDLLAVVCCFALILLPLSTAWAQKDLLNGTKEGIQKGAEGVKEGAETAIKKTKEGAEAVGKAAKDLVTDDDKNTTKGEPTSGRTKPSETQRSTSPAGTSSQKASGTPGSTTNTERRESKLPATAGEQPLLALVGAIALVTAAALGTVQRRKPIRVSR